MEAEIDIPHPGGRGALSESGVPVGKAAGLRVLSETPQATRLRAGSGFYDFAT
jgi:hypothetical protein